ncbi:LuxR C-terminal-related transcriptional regulator [Antribacter gilvus]|uniref:LuxR C-terminal-related transcriptional regulator n=1 Tax=Antribacter gilvus TaxID=2304675 RepID=UPI000F7AA651|nr:LuxR C-terminal-related transcriptional regulator [Antribacter gilvus]
MASVSTREQAGRLPDEGSEIVEGIEAVRERLTQLAAGCRSSLWAFQPGGAQSPAALAASRPLDKATLARGVDMRTIYLDSLRNDQPTLDHITWLAERGAEVRTVPTLPMRMLVVDRQVAVIPLDPEDSSAGALLLSTAPVVAGLAELFLATWRRAAPFCERRPRRSTVFAPQEQRALELWAEGCTDQMVARKLGVSHRTVRRISDRVSAEIGATSRFQVGLRASELGLVRSAELP